MTITQWIAVVAPVVVIIVTHLLSRLHLKAIQVNVDGNLSEAIAMARALKLEVESSKTMIAGLEELIAQQVVSSADQAKAIANLTSVVDKNGGTHRRSTD